MFGFFLNTIINYKPFNFIQIAKMRNSTLVYNELTKSLLIDNSLKKDLEIARKRKMLNAKTKYKDNKDIMNSFHNIEMSESHRTQHYKNKK
jgi:hypothetical protein